MGHEPRTRSNPTCERRSQGDSLQLNRTVREKLADFPLLYTPDVRVPGIVDVVIIPNNQPSLLYHPEHLRGDLLLHGGIENRGKDLLIEERGRT